MNPDLQEAHMVRSHLFTKKAREIVEARRKAVEYAKSAAADATSRLTKAEEELEGAEDDLRRNEELDRQGSGFGFSRDEQRAYRASTDN